MPRSSTAMDSPAKCAVLHLGTLIRRRAAKFACILATSKTRASAAWRSCPISALFVRLATKGRRTSRVKSRLGFGCWHKLDVLDRMTSGLRSIGFARNSALATKVDNLDTRQRSNAMARVRARGNASTELKVVSLFRKNKIKGWRRHLPIVGRPDFTFPKAKLTVFVDGCFWHGCPRCYSTPTTSKAFWKAKLAKNKVRDLAVNRQLRKDGWNIIRIWECKLKNPDAFLRSVAKLTR